MRRVLTWLAGGLGAAALVRQLLRRHPARPSARPTTVDPAEELRAKLEQARGVADDRDEFDAAQGTPVDEVERPSSLEERRRRVHDKAQEALGEMRGPEES